LSQRSWNWGLAKHIKGMHEGQLKYVPAAYGGTLDADIDSTIKETPEIGIWQQCGITQVIQWSKERNRSLSPYHFFWQWMMFQLMLYTKQNISVPCLSHLIQMQLLYQSTK
jgi:hypothetical protein